MEKLVNYSQIYSIVFLIAILVHFGYQDMILKNHSINLIWSTIIGSVAGMLGMATTAAAQKFSW